MSQLIDNERTELLANALDRASTACLTVGVLAPLAALLYNVSSGHIGMWVFVGGGVIWFSVAIGLHLTARWTLRSLA